MMVDTHSPSTVAERIEGLSMTVSSCPRLTSETIGWFSAAGHADAVS